MADFNLENYFEEYVEYVIQQFTEAYESSYRRAVLDYFDLVSEKVKTIFEDTIQSFYADYTPIGYDRDNSLFNLLQIDKENDAVSFWLDPTKMTPFRNGYNGEDGLYEQVFKRGWHGGAARSDRGGVPYWRTPTPYYIAWGDEAKIADVSPYDNLMRRISDYEENEAQAEFDSILSAYINKIKIES